MNSLNYVGISLFVIDLDSHTKISNQEKIETFLINKNNSDKPSKNSNSPLANNINYKRKLSSSNFNEFLPPIK